MPASVPVNSKTEPAVDAIEYSSFGSDISLSPPAVTIVVITAGSGSLVVTTTGGDADRTLTVADGEEIPCEVSVIKSGTNVTRLRAYFNKGGNSAP